MEYTQTCPRCSGDLHIVNDNDIQGYSDDVMHLVCDLCGTNFWEYK